MVTAVLAVLRRTKWHERPATAGKLQDTTSMHPTSRHPMRMPRNRACYLSLHMQLLNAPL